MLELVVRIKFKPITDHKLTKWLVSRLNIVIKTEDKFKKMFFSMNTLKVNTNLASSYLAPAS